MGVEFTVKSLGWRSVMVIAGSRLTASQSLAKGSDLYAYPAGTSFCSCASSRAALHVGSLFLRNRQPSNTPPLLLSPTGRATRRGPQMQNTLGDTPRPHARQAQPPLQSGRPSVTLRAALPAAVRPPLPTRSCDLAGTPLARSERLCRPEAWAKRCL